MFTEENLSRVSSDVLHATHVYQNLLQKLAVLQEGNRPTVTQLESFMGDLEEANVPCTKASPGIESQAFAVVYYLGGMTIRLFFNYRDRQGSVKVRSRIRDV